MSNNKVLSQEERVIYKALQARIQTMIGCGAVEMRLGESIDDHVLVIAGLAKRIHVLCDCDEGDYDERCGSSDEERSANARRWIEDAFDEPVEDADDADQLFTWDLI
jgi:hypothetical protein